MGRQPKLTVEYFPHQIGNGKKMFTIQKKYGNDGYATWFKILEIIGETDNHYMDLSTKSELMYVAAKCNISEERLLEILSDLCELKEIDSDLWQIKVVWNQKFVDSIQKAYSKRTNPCITKAGIIDIFVKKGKLKGNKNPPEKAMKSLTAPVKFNFRAQCIQEGVPTNIIDEWLLVRKTKKATNSETAFKAFIREAQAANLTAAQAAQTCVEQSWAGFKAMWMESVKKSSPNNNPTENVDWSKEQQNHAS